MTRTSVSKRVGALGLGDCWTRCKTGASRQASSLSFPSKSIEFELGFATAVGPSAEKDFGPTAMRSTSRTKALQHLRHFERRVGKSGVGARHLLLLFVTTLLCLHGRARFDFVGSASRYKIAVVQVSKDFDQLSRTQPCLHVNPFCLAVPNPNHKGLFIRMCH